MYELQVIDGSSPFQFCIGGSTKKSFKIKISIDSCSDEAKEILQNKKDFSFIISDYKIPKGTGKDVLEYLSDNNTNIPTVICSSGDYKECCSGYGNYISFVGKDNLSQLTNVLKNHITSFDT